MEEVGGCFISTPYGRLEVERRSPLWRVWGEGGGLFLGIFFMPSDSIIDNEGPGEIIALGANLLDSPPPQLLRVYLSQSCKFRKQAAFSAKGYLILLSFLPPPPPRAPPPARACGTAGIMDCCIFVFDLL